MPYIGEIRNRCASDLNRTEEMANRYARRTIEIYNMQNTLSQKVKMSFGAILNNEDIMSVISESRLVNEEMIDLLGKAEKQDKQNIIAFPWAAKKGE